VGAHELARADETAYDAVCFHAQQCVEKLLKAVLVLRNVDPPYTHNLLELAELVRPLHPEIKLDPKDLRYLTRGGVAFRYPGESATAAHAAKAMEICTRLREALLELLRDPQKGDSE
ncbi:MAG: HEPN domain-containing protein, partial [Phycisphaerales bacterium]|nr:HEPN domain-containing protein [Phycisphaerales bacterium]